MITEYNKNPSIKVRLVAIWLWLSSFYYLFNAFVISATILILVSLEIATNGSKFVILQDNYIVILFPLFFTFISFLYQYNSFKLISLTKKSFYMSCFLVLGHFIFNLTTILAMNFLLSAMSKQNIVPSIYSSLVGINFLIILPVICIVLLAFSYKEFNYSERRLSTKAHISIIFFSVLPVLLSIFLIIWGTTEILDTDFNYAKTQNVTEFVIYKPEIIPTGMFYATKFQSKKEDSSVTFLLLNKKDSTRVITVSQYSSIKKDSASLLTEAVKACKEVRNDCTVQDVIVTKSKTGKGKYVPSQNVNQYIIIYDTKDGTTVLAGFFNFSTDSALTFINSLM